ncbi:hypothetical protein DPSP01_002175 [Paraphaeosphaeria sporulosa]
MEPETEKPASNMPRDHDAARLSSLWHSDNDDFSDEPNTDYRPHTSTHNSVRERSPIPSDPDLDSLPYSDDDRDPSDPERVYEEHVSDARLDHRNATLELASKHGFNWHAIPEWEMQKVDEEYGERLAAAYKEYRASACQTPASGPCKGVKMRRPQMSRRRAGAADARGRGPKWMGVDEELWKAREGAARWKSWCIWVSCLAGAVLLVLGAVLLKAWSDVNLCEAERWTLLQEAGEGLWYMGEGEGMK